VDTYSYKQKTEGKQFIDFKKRVDQKYVDSIKQIFLIVDNTSIHKYNKVKETLAKLHPRIHLVFLPTRSPNLNLIEVRWLYWMHRQAIKNSIFLKEQDIGKAVSDWTYDYTKNHAGRTSSISLQEVSCVYITVNLTFFYNYYQLLKCIKKKVLGYSTVLKDTEL